jgi:hypothetical protein
MNLRILLGSAFVVTLACSSHPPPIDSGDASTEAGGSDAATDGATDAGGGDAGGSDGGSCTLTSPPPSQACVTCLESNASCCTRWNACAANADCTSYVACIQKCYPPDAGTPDAGLGDGGLPPIGDGGEGGGFACAKACDSAYPNGVNDGTAVVDCLDTTCAGLCN